jgi:preprotein translocase subunit SecY
MPTCRGSLPKAWALRSIFGGTSLLIVVGVAMDTVAADRVAADHAALRRLHEEDANPGGAAERWR